MAVKRRKGPMICRPLYDLKFSISMSFRKPMVGPGWSREAPGALWGSRGSLGVSGRGRGRRAGKQRLRRLLRDGALRLAIGSDRCQSSL